MNFYPKGFFFGILICLLAGQSHAQGVAVNASGLPADTSAQLDVSSDSKGLLVPRLTQSQRDNIISPAKALLIFNTTSQQFEVNTGAPNTPSWEGIVTFQSSELQGGYWKSGGNGVATETGKIGSINAKALELITANTLRLYIDSTGNKIGINTNHPKAGLHIATTDALVLPTGTTAQRPPQPIVGMIRFNHEIGKLEGYTSVGWKLLQ